MPSTHTINLSKEYNSSPAALFELIRNGELFRLTGADKIEFDFKEGGMFHFHFKNLGIISGTFDSIEENKKVKMMWDVTGFDKPDEVNTCVTISIHEKEKTSLSIEHTQIKNEDAAIAKKKAWSEILDDLEKEIIVH